MDFFSDIISGLDVSDKSGSTGGIGDFSQMLTDISDNINDMLNDVVDIAGGGEESENIFTDLFNDNNDSSSSNNNEDMMDFKFEMPPLFQFAVADIENSNDACDLLDQIEADFNTLMTLADPAKIFDPFLATANNEDENKEIMNNEDGEDGVDNLFEGIGEFFSTAADVLTNTLNTVVDIVAHTSPRCIDSDDATLREVFSDFTKCSGVDMTITEFMTAFNVDAVDIGFKCIDQIFPEIAVTSDGDRQLMNSENPSSFCSTAEDASQLFNLVPDCTSDILGENVIGELFKMMLVTPGATCSCLSILDGLPECRTSFENGVFADGGRMKKYKCLLESSTCPFFESACDDRLEALDTCLPSLDKFRNIDPDNTNSAIDCKEVMCSCEDVENNQSINYAAQLMQLPLTDMCQKEAETSDDSMYGDVPQRYELLRSTCGYTSKDIFDNFYSKESQEQQQEQPATLVEEEVVVQQEENEVEKEVMVQEEEDEVEDQPFGVLQSEDVAEDVETVAAVVKPFEEIATTVVFSSSKYAPENEKDGNLVGIFIGLIAAIFTMAIAIVVYLVVFKEKNSTINTKQLQHYPGPPVGDIQIIKSVNTEETSDFFTDDGSSKVSVSKTESITP